MFTFEFFENFPNQTPRHSLRFCRIAERKKFNAGMKECMINGVWKHPDEVFNSVGSFDFRSPDGINWPPYVWTGYSWDNRAWNVFPMVNIPA